ncbi:MAG: chemotaxis protein CheX [Dehalococcoidia bacterium]
MLAKVTVDEAARVVAADERPPRLDLVGPFLEAAARVIKQECGETVGKGQVHRVRSPQTTNEVSAMIAITGSVAGLVIYSMSRPVALSIASKMIGEPQSDFDELPQSAIAELANIITGQASIGLERNGFPSIMSPPILLVGQGSSIATFNLTRLVVPLVVEAGEFLVDVAIKEA